MSRGGMLGRVCAEQIGFNEDSLACFDEFRQPADGSEGFRQRCLDICRRIGGTTGDRHPAAAGFRDLQWRG